MTHTFKIKTVHKPTNCEACDGLLWGVRHQGQQCQGKKKKTYLLNNKGVKGGGWVNL